jgi:hypothetical protein
LADYGHLGAEAHAFALGFNETAGNNVSASSRVSLYFNDFISVISDTLPYGSEVPIDLSYRITGDVSNPRSLPFPGYSLVGIDGYLLLDYVNNYGTPMFYSAFCANASVGSRGCAHDPDTSSSTWSFEIKDDPVVYLTVGLTYRISAYMEIVASSAIDPTKCYYALGCDSDASLYSLHSFLTNLTPAAEGAHLISESGHEYSISAIPEPPIAALSAAGVSLMLYARRKGRSRINKMHLQ